MVIAVVIRGLPKGASITPFSALPLVVTLSLPKGALEHAILLFLKLYLILFYALRRIGLLRYRAYSFFSAAAVAYFLALPQKVTKRASMA